MYVSGRSDLFDEPAGSVVVAVDKVHLDPNILEPGHLLIEEQSGFETLQAGVVQITRNNKEVDLLGYRRIQHLLERPTRSIANFRHRSAWVLGKTHKRSI